MQATRKPVISLEAHRLLAKMWAIYRTHTTPKSRGVYCYTHEYLSVFAGGYWVELAELFEADLVNPDYPYRLTAIKASDSM